MRRFTLAVSAYVLLCLLAAVAIVLRGDGPHPRIVAIYPPAGDRYWPGGIAQITFSQPMNHDSVQSALQVSPPGQGQEIWYGNTLNLQPLDDWQPDTTYHIALTGSVVDTLGRPLHTPVIFWFRVTPVTHLHICSVHGVRNVCAGAGVDAHPITRFTTPVLQFALSPDRTALALTRADTRGIAHLFLLQTDGSGIVQVNRGSRYSDSNPFWAHGDSADVSYYRQPVVAFRPHPVLGARQLWNVAADGSENARL